MDTRQGSAYGLPIDVMVKDIWLLCEWLLISCEMCDALVTASLFGTKQLRLFYANWDRQP